MSEDLDDIRAEHEREKMALTVLKRRQLEGELIPAKDVRLFHRRVLTRIASMLRGAPSAISGVPVPEEHTDALRHALSEWADSCLGSLKQESI